MKIEYEQLTGVASSRRRKLLAEQDSRMGRTSSNESVSPRLTIATARIKISLAKIFHKGDSHSQHEQLRLNGFA